MFFLCLNPRTPSLLSLDSFMTIEGRANFKSLYNPWFANIFAMVSPTSTIGTSKKMRFGHKLKFSNFYIFATQWPLICQTMNSFLLNSLKCLTNQSCTPWGCKDMGIRKFEFVAKTKCLGVKKKSLRLLSYLQDSPYLQTPNLRPSS